MSSCSICSFKSISGREMEEREAYLLSRTMIANEQQQQEFRDILDIKMKAKIGDRHQIVNFSYHIN